LTAIQNHLDAHGNKLLSDDSSLDTLGQSSMHTCFCSLRSNLSNATNDSPTLIPPNSIFLDDNNISRVQKSQNPSDDLRVDDCGDSQSDVSVFDTQNVDEFLNYEEDTTPADNMSDEDDVTVQSTTSFEGNEPCDQYEPHCFDQMSRDETASFQIMSLLDAAGAPRICYNRLVSLLKKLSKHEGFDVKKALNRETLMRRIERRHKSRPRIQSAIINQQEVFRFRFHDMLQDLLYSSSSHLHQILPKSHHAITDSAATTPELWNTQWMCDTFAMEPYVEFDAKNDIMLPIILYMDKTGTDVNQRYSLEPVLFTIASIPREHRESRHSWRHVGFVPQKQQCSEDESTSDLQFYHHCLSYLLDGLREAQKKPPRVIVKQKNGDMVERRAFLPVMVVMGDQLSQDTLCGRMKSNSGGAGRVHRNCMCSYLNIDDPYHQCKQVNLSQLQLLVSCATISDDDISSQPITSSTVKQGRITRSFLLKQRSMFRSILRHPYTTHPITNAFDGIDFGSWSAGIHDATFDDFMHSVEAGMVAYITESVYDGLTKKEKEAVEELTRNTLDEQRSSVTSNYPRWRLQPGFTRQTLMTSGERVGSILALCLSLQDPTIRDTIRMGHARQIKKYLDLSTEFPIEAKNRVADEEMLDCQQKHSSIAAPPEFYLNQYMHSLEDQHIRHTLEQMIRHGFPIELLHDLDPFQINQMIWHCVDLFKNVKYPDHYPIQHIDGSYVDLGSSWNLPKEQFAVVKFACQTRPSKLLKQHRYRKVEGTTGKHLMKKANKKGEGSSAAVLTHNMGTLVIFLEYVLCYHAFCKYSYSLPSFMQCNYENILAGNRFVVEYYQKLIYRGNNSVDSRFPKIHSQCRMGENTKKMNTVMNFCCETGERLLKTEAKGIARTAQQRGDGTFITQTMSRIQERSVLDSFAMYLQEKKKTVADSPNRSEGCDHFGRTHPHFIFDVDSDEIYALSRKNEPSQPNDQSGYIALEIKDALKQHEPGVKRFEIYNEVVLRDNSRLRASPNYSKSGPWYDYANISWEKVENDMVEMYLLPAKCLCFFRRGCETSGEEDMMALVHSVKQSTKGRSDGRIDTLLTRNYAMEFNNRGQPITHVVPIASIDSSVRCFAHTPSKSLFNPDRPGITYLLPRNHWAYMWMAVNDALMESNSNENIKQRRGKLVSMCNSQWLQHVRERYQQYICTTNHVHSQ
jgi:hypothetical protein